MAESIYRFLIQDALSTGGSKGDTGGKDIKDDYEKDIEDRRDRKKSIQQRLGIQLTLAGILKQSSIFTGVLGSLFQILGAFVDTFLMAFFPLLKGALKFIMSFFEPIKAIGAGISEVVEFTMKLFNKVGEIFNAIKGFLGLGNDASEGTGPKGESSAGAGMMERIGNIIKGAGVGGLKRFSGIGSLLRIGSGIADFASAEDAAGKTTAIAQTIIGTALAGGAGMLGAGLGSFAGPVGTVAGGAGGAALYDTLFADAVDNGIHNIVHALMGKGNEEAMLAGVPVN
mgnify:FL=1